MIATVLPDSGIEIVTSEDIDDVTFADKFACYTCSMTEKWLFMIEKSSALPRKYLANFGNLRKFSKFFGNVPMTFRRCSKIFQNLWRSSDNARKSLGNG